MVKFYKFAIVTASLMLVAFMAACGSDSSTGAGTKSQGGEVGTDEQVTVNIAHGNQPDEPVGQLAEKWKELAEDRSDNRLNIEIYPSSQLGAEKDVVEQAISGNNVVVLAGFDFLMDYVPDAGILTAPYLADSFDDLLYLTTTDWFEDLENDLRDENIEIITAKTVYGERHLLTNDKVTTLEELKGLNIRVPDNQMSIKTFDAMGASATPYPLDELYTALQQGLVDGAENPLSVLHGVQAHEVSKHLSLTGHQKFIVSWIAGTDFVETIPDDLVEILKDTGDEASDYAREILEEETEAVLKEFEDAGVEIHETDTETFEEAVKEVYDSFSDWTPGLYDTVLKLLNEH